MFEHPKLMRFYSAASLPDMSPAQGTYHKIKNTLKHIEPLQKKQYRSITREET